MTDEDILSTAERLRLFEAVTVHSGEGVLVARAASAAGAEEAGEAPAPDLPYPKVVFANETLLPNVRFCR